MISKVLVMREKGVGYITYRPTHFSIITGMKIIVTDDCMHLVPLYSVFTSIGAYRVLTVDSAFCCWIRGYTL